MTDPELQQASQIEEAILSRERHESRIRVGIGLGITAVGMSIAASIASGVFDDERFEQPMPFNETAQEIVNSVDDGLAATGKILLPASLFAIGAVKLSSARSNRLRSIDKRSSQELSDEGHHPSFVRRGLRNVAAGSMPVVVSASAAVGALTAGIGSEITNGPSRPIQAFGELAPGESMVTQYPGAMPMLESNISAALSRRIQDISQQRGVNATPIDLGLHSIQNGTQRLTGLTLGVEERNLPPELQSDSCETIPVYSDESAGFKTGAKLMVNNVEVTVVGEAENISAINRIGLVMDKDLMGECIDKDQKPKSHAVILDTDQQTANEILAEANPGNKETATVITQDEYIKNSEKFWESNVKPITNTLALVGLMTSFIAMGGNAVSRMLRNRRELAAKLAAGESVNHFRATEMLRAAKDGVLGSTVGVTAAAALTVPVNALESGMRVGLGVHEAMVGYAVGLVGTLAGTLLHIVRPNKVVDPSEHTRV